MKLLLILGTFCLTAFAAETAGTLEFFENNIRPTFARSCFPCHSAVRMGGLDMSSRAGLLKGGNIGTAIVPGKPDESLLIQAVTHQHERIKMPQGQPRLSDQQVANLAEWVKAGAFWPEGPKIAPTKAVITDEQRKFWSFQPVSKPTPPKVQNQAWAKTNIDRFLLAKMEAKGVVPAKPADRATLLRRVYFDLHGLPPAAADIEKFVNDKAPDTFAKVVDQLLASPRYGERWGRHWLDIARYSDDRLESEIDAPYANAFRYRDWVIQAINDDMPYDVFLKSQIAGDQLPNPHQHAAGLGFFALRPDTQDDRVDVTGRAFLGLTTGCAQCHNHKFDPIPTTDFYALLGVFESTQDTEFPLADAKVVDQWKAQDKQVQAKKAQIRDFLQKQADALAEVFAQQTARYLRAARRVVDTKDVAQIAKAENLDAETFERWVRYLKDPNKDHPYLKDWNDQKKFDPDQFQTQVLNVLKERKQVDDENAIIASASKNKGSKSATEPVSLKPQSFYLWRDLFFSDLYGRQFKQEDDGLLFYGPNRGYFESDGTIERFLSGEFKAHLSRMREELAVLQSKLPERYPYLHTIEDSKALKTERVRIGGAAENLGEEVPRRFLTIFGARKFENGAGRLELAEAIASKENPLTARVAVNRLWHHHFGAGLVRTPSDFGFMGDRPSNPELLDYLAATLTENGWSMKKLHREIVLSAAYQTSSEKPAKNEEIDPDNRLYWRANVRRLDAEALRDSLLAVSGELDPSLAGPPAKLDDPANHRRSVYGYVSRRKLDGTLALFDFPNPNQTSEKRSLTITPPQQLFLLNSEFALSRADRLAQLASKATKPEQGIAALYQNIYGRSPSEQETKLGASFVKQANWTQYAQALLNSNEFLLIN